MAETKLMRPLAEVSAAHQVTAGTTNAMNKTHPKLGTVLADTMLPSRVETCVEVVEQTPSELELATKTADASKQVSKSDPARPDLVPVAGLIRESIIQEFLPGFAIPQSGYPIFPGLLRATENSLSKGEVRSTLSTSLLPRSGTLLSQPFRHNENTFGRVKSPQVTTAANVLTSRNTTQTVQDSTSSLSPVPPPAIVGLTSTFNIKPTAQSKGTLAAALPLTMLSTVPLLPAQASASDDKQQQRTYLLPDGTVTSSGKGLGRGRPGIKRGPRKSKLAMEITAESSKTTGETIMTPPLQEKRKRVGPDNPTDPTTSSEPSSRASSVEFIPENTQTRSGRQALKPSVFVPSTTPTPVAKKPRQSSPGPSVPKPAALAKIKRKTYRGREHAALCEHCLRGHGPPANVIIFCDACNKCWHQRCHEPQVSEAVIKDTKAEWYCNDCEKIINGSKKGAKRSTPKSKPSLSLSFSPVVPVPLIGASSLTREQREAQLAAASKEKLIELLMRATDLAPALPLFENPHPPVVTTPITSRPIDSYPTPTQEEDDYDYLYDEHAALYPKPGNGVKLPPESADLAMLLEGPDCKTFSHQRKEDLWPHLLQGEPM